MTSPRRTAALCCAVSTLVAAHAFAQGPPAPRPDDPPPHEQRVLVPPQGAVRNTSPDPAFEAPLLLGQLAAGGAVSAAILLAPDDSKLAVGALLPIAVGTVVGAIGNASDSYRGFYVYAIAGAYVGAVTVLPLALLGAEQAGDTTDYSKSLVLAGIGWFVIQPAVSVGFWHLGRHFRDAPPSPRPKWIPPPRLPDTTHGLTSLPGQVVVPLLALSF